MDEPRILVCDQCFTRVCWNGELMCWNARTAGLVMATKAQLDQLGREHPSYYEKVFAKGGEFNTLEPWLEDSDVEKETHQG